MDDTQDLSDLDAKIDQVIEYVKTARQTNETLKVLLLEKDKKINELEKVLHAVEERVQLLYNQLPTEKG